MYDPTSDVVIGFAYNERRRNVMNNKVISMMVAALLVIVAGAVMMDVASDSDATASGSVKVYYKGTGGWSDTTVSAFDLYQAVETAKTTLGYTITITGENSTWNKLEDGYYNPDKDYGTISQINGSSDFTVYVYDDESSAWVVAKAPLGWYRPFEDYAQTVTFQDGTCAGASNVAISTDGTVPTATDVIDFTSVGTGADYRYAFTLKNNQNTINVPAGTNVKIKDGRNYVTHELTTTELRAGITIYGYGSDAYLALKDALSPVTGGDYAFELVDMGSYQYYQYYSWMDEILNAGTQSIYGSDSTGNFSQYIYWVQSGTGTTAGADYTLGYYSMLSGSYNNLGAFTLTYDITEKYYY